MSKLPLTPAEYDSYSKSIEDYLRKESPEHSWFVERYEHRFDAEGQIPTVFSVCAQTQVGHTLLSVICYISVARMTHSGTTKQVLGKIRRKCVNKLNDRIGRVRS